MQHTIPADSLGVTGEMMAHAIETCVHCGFCLPTCPTYTVLQEEMDSPRGRIVLMKSVLESDIELDDALPYIDRCLGCLSCVTACPSGVRYDELLTPFKEYAEGQRSRPLVDRAARKLTLQTLPYPIRFRWAAQAGQLSKSIGNTLPIQFRSMLDLLPDTLPSNQPLPGLFPAQGQKRARVVLLAGCVQQVLAQEINWATLRVLARNGVEVVIPPDQGCCGALAMHTGENRTARKQALHNMNVFPSDVDAIVTNAAGCGSGMKEYSLLFKCTQWEGEAAEFASRVQDISEFLDDLGIIEPHAIRFGENGNLNVAYHDACHLAHAQGIIEPPRRLLQKVPNLTLLPIIESELCCGSAGTYNLEHPDTARKLGERKVFNIRGTGADVVVTGNIGCLIQLRNHLSTQENSTPVWHTIELLDKAYTETT